MFDFDVRLTAIDLVVVALVSCLPGILAGLVLGAVVWRAHRTLGAAIGGAAGLVLNAVALSLWHATRLPTGGVSWLGNWTPFA